MAGVFGALTAAGCGSDGDKTTENGAGTNLPQGREHVDLDPADFTTKIDNPYWPMAPGSMWVYEEVEDGVKSRDVITVTDKTRKIEGITARVLHDVASENGQVIENTYDWYAQDSAGNIWYLGEHTKAFENGKFVTTKGSWEAGVNGAEPGVLIPADPRPGLTYRQEGAIGEAEDFGRVFDVNQQVEVPFGHFRNTLFTQDLTPLEPKLVELKWYARGVGRVLTLTVSDGAGREELISFKPGKQG